MVWNQVQFSGIKMRSSSLGASMSHFAFPQDPCMLYLFNISTIHDHETYKIWRVAGVICMQVHVVQLFPQLWPEHVPTRSWHVEKLLHHRSGAQAFVFSTNQLPDPSLLILNGCACNNSSNQYSAGILLQLTKISNGWSMSCPFFCVNCTVHFLVTSCDQVLSDLHCSQNRSETPTGCHHSLRSLPPG